MLETEARNFANSKMPKTFQTRKSQKNFPNSQIAKDFKLANFTKSHDARKFPEIPQCSKLCYLETDTRKKTLKLEIMKRNSKLFFFLNVKEP